MDYLSKFSETLKELMEEKNLTQNQVAKVANCGHGSVSRWLNNENYPSLINLVKLSEYFNCSIEYLFRKTDDKKLLYSEIISTFSERLKSLAIGKQKSLVKIAKELNIDNAILYRWSNGVYNPGAEGLLILADYFGCTVDYLVGRKD